MQVENAAQPGEFVISEKPGVPVDLRGEDQAAVEGLKDKVVFPEIETGREADSMVFRQALEIRRQAARQRPGTIMGGGRAVFHVDVDVGLLSAPQERGGMGFCLAEIEPVVEDNQIRRILPACGHGLGECRLFLIPQLSADGIELKELEPVIAAKAHQQIGAGLFLCGRIPESVRPAPQPQPAGERFGQRGNAAPAIGILGLELIALQVAVVVGAVDIAGIPRIDAQPHSILIVQPLEKLKIDKGLPFR